MINIHEKEVNKIAECNLLHDIISPPKRDKYLNGHYSLIIHGCMNTRLSRARFKNFLIILDIGCSSAVVMGRLVEKIRLREDYVMQLHTQSGNIINNLKVKIDITLPALSLTNFMTW